MKVIIGIPAFNEEKNIAAIVVKLKKKYDHVLVCDDGSSDMTHDIASSLGAIVVKHPTNLGYGAAIKTIFNEARKIDGDILITFDAARLLLVLPAYALCNSIEVVLATVLTI